MAWQVMLAATLDLGGDIEFLRQKSLNGDLIIVTGSVTATGEIVQYTPATGKTFFIYLGQTFHSNRGAVAGAYGEAEIRNDGTVKDTIGTAFNASSGASNAYTPQARSVITGDKLVGNAVKKYSIHCTVIQSASTRLFATLIGWIENT